MPSRLLEPLPRAQAAAIEHLLAVHESRAGFAPNSYLIWARNPRSLLAWPEIARAGMVSAAFDTPTRFLVSFVASAQGGCVYCMTHLSIVLSSEGVPPEKLGAILHDLDGTPVVDERTRAALRLARDLSASPPRVTNQRFAEARRHFSEDEVIEIAFQVAHFGFLTRLNSLFGTPLEPAPYAYGVEHLAPFGWRPGVHKPEDAAPLLDVAPYSLTRVLMPEDDAPTFAPAPVALDDASAATARNLGLDLTSLGVLARRPALLGAMLAFWTALHETSSLDGRLTALVGEASSAAAGSEYWCAYYAREGAVATTDAERAAVRLAQATSPDAALISELRRRYDDRTLLDLVLLLARLAFFHRWQAAFPVRAEAGTSP